MGATEVWHVLSCLPETPQTRSEWRVPSSQIKADICFFHSLESFVIFCVYYDDIDHCADSASFRPIWSKTGAFQAGVHHPSHQSSASALQLLSQV